MKLPSVIKNDFLTRELFFLHQLNNVNSIIFQFYIHSRMPWIHMNELCSASFQSMYIWCSKSQVPVSGWCFSLALQWLVDGSQGFNHFSYFSITVMQLDSLIYANDIPMFDTLLVWMATTQNKLKEINNHDRDAHSLPNCQQ